MPKWKRLSNEMRPPTLSMNRTPLHKSECAIKEVGVRSAFISSGQPFLCCPTEQQKGE
jgi:hypothetical protein